MKELEVTGNLKREDIKDELDRYYELLRKYNHNTEDFIITKMLVVSDSMNDISWCEVQELIVCIPKKFADVASKITTNFTCDNIVLLDKNDNVLCHTCDIGYDDVQLPKFFI